MAETEQTKVCPLCAETIKAAAKVCPYCRKSQQWWAITSPYEICTILITALILVTVLVIERTSRHPRDFGSDKDKVLVTGFHFDVSKGRYFTNVVVVGVLTNGSGNSWRIEDIQVRFLDKDRKLLVFDDDPLIDAFTILPNSDHAFRLTLGPPKSVPNFATCTVQVASADDPRAIIKSR